MPKVSLAGFSDPLRRPKFIVWTVVTVVILGALLTVTLGVTSTRWFCSEACHKVQDDTILAYNHSTHSQISCMACHLPVNASPITFMLHKAEALGELYLTVTDSFELPLNPEDSVAEKMPSAQCEQCHDMVHRKVTPSSGIIIDHPVHAKNNIKCTTCHNRVAHKEDFKLKLAGNRKHADWMKMEACFRCHGQEQGATAPGGCPKCHPPSFKLMPDSHLQADFYNRGGVSTGHWKLQKQDPKYCEQCHTTAWCTACHGVVMSHSADFVNTHGEIGRRQPKICLMCHDVGKSSAKVGGTKASSPNFCNGCHHKGADPGVPWIKQHFKVVQKTDGTGGSSQCMKCHSPTECAQCHVRSSQ